jgi:hypothetical protein
MVNYFEEKYKLFEKIKSKKYIKYNGRNEEIYLIENNYNKSDSNEQRETSGIAIIYIEN